MTDATTEEQLQNDYADMLWGLMDSIAQGKENLFSLSELPEMLAHIAASNRASMSGDDMAMIIKIGATCARQAVHEANATGQQLED